MLRVYTAIHCPGHIRTRLVVAELLRQQPDLGVELIDLDKPDAERPSFVFGTPTFVWDNQILFLGNPTAEDLMARLDEVRDKRDEQG